MKKTLSITVTLVFILTMLAACGSSKDTAATTPAASPAASAKADTASAPGAADSAIKGKVTFVTNRTDMIGKQYVDYAKKFHEKYPNAEINFEAIPDYDKTIKVRLASGDLPDILLIPTIPKADLPKYFAPLDDLGLTDKIYFKDFQSTDGKLYGIASGGNTSGIVYNKNAFKNAGITAVPKTLDEFYAASDKLKAKGITPLASNFKDKWPLGGWMNDGSAIASGSASTMNDRKKSDAPYAVDGPIFAGSMILKNMYAKGYLEKDINSTNWELSKKDVASGKSAMYYLGNWVINQVIENGAKSEDIGFFPLPINNTGKLSAPLGPDWFYGVNKDSKNVETAKAFVKWLIEDSGYDDFAGFIPVLKDKKSQLAQLTEFMAANPTMIEGVANDDDTTAINNKAQITPEDMVQEIVLGDPKAIADKYNKKWADAKKSLGK
jgi:raffinose/stachyose/melibiose transport system substrate-binding protein